MLLKGKDEGDRAKAGNPHLNGRSPRPLEPATLKEIGVTKSDSSRWQKVAQVPRDEIAQLVEEATDRRREASTAMVIKLEMAAQGDARGGRSHHVGFLTLQRVQPVG